MQTQVTQNTSEKLYKENILDPHKFESITHLFTASQTKHKSTISWLSFYNKMQVKEVELEENLDLFVSYVPSHNQVHQIIYGLDEYNDIVREAISQDTTCKVATIVLSIGDTTTAGMSGIFNNNTLIFDNPPFLKFPLREQEANSIKIDILSQLLHNFNLNYNLEQVLFIDLDQNKEQHFIELLILLGFSYHTIATAKYVNLYVNSNKIKQNFTETHRLFKNVSINFDLEEYSSFIQSLNIIEPPNSYLELINYLTCANNQFGLFVKNEEQKYVGGVLGEVIKTNQFIQSFPTTVKKLSVTKKGLYLATVWLDQSIRGKKISAKLIELAELHAKNIGCSFSSLNTSSYHAPWLYHKLGYKEVEKIEVTETYTEYLFKKRLRPTF